MGLTMSKNRSTKIIAQAVFACGILVRSHKPDQELRRRLAWNDVDAPGALPPLPAATTGAEHVVPVPPAPYNTARTMTNRDSTGDVVMGTDSAGSRTPSPRPMDTGSTISSPQATASGSMTTPSGSDPTSGPRVHGRFRASETSRLPDDKTPVGKDGPPSVPSRRAQAVGRTHKAARYRRQFTRFQTLKKSLEEDMQKRTYDFEGEKARIDALREEIRKAEEKMRWDTIEFICVKIRKKLSGETKSLDEEVTTDSERREKLLKEYQIFGGTDDEDYFLDCHKAAVTLLMRELLKDDPDYFVLGDCDDPEEKKRRRKWCATYNCSFDDFLDLVERAKARS